MANRHTHKKLRAEIRARMRATGESYQRARSRIVRAEGLPSAMRTELVPISYFGIPGTLATVEAQGIATFAFVPSATLWGRGYPHTLPLPLLRGHSGTRGVQ